MYQNYPLALTNTLNLPQVFGKSQILPWGALKRGDRVRPLHQWCPDTRRKTHHSGARTLYPWESKSGYTKEKIRNLNDHCNDDCKSSLE